MCIRESWPVSDNEIRSSVEEMPVLDTRLTHIEHTFDAYLVSRIDRFDSALEMD